MTWVHDRALRARAVAVTAVALGVVAVAAYATALLAAPTANVFLRPVLARLTESTWTGTFWIADWLPPVVAAAAVVATFAVAAVRVPVGDDVRLATRPRDGALLDRVDAVARDVSVPTPTVAVRPLDAPNALTFGIRRSSTTLVVTRGLLDQLDDDELDAVLAHELAHVRNGDARALAVVSVVLAPLASVALAGRPLLGFLNRRGRNASVLDALSVVGLAAVVVPFAVVLVGPFAATRAVVVRGLTRYRDPLADVAAGAVTGRADALADALETIDGATIGDDATTDDEGMDENGDERVLVSGAVDGGYLAPVPADPVSATVDALLSTELGRAQPPTTGRVERLRRFAAADGSTGDERGPAERPDASR